MSQARIHCETTLDAPFEKVLEAIWRPATMEYVSRPLVRFRPVEPDRLPDRWRNGQFMVSLRLFGLLPIGRQVIGIAFDDSQANRFIGFDRGHSKLMRRWEHEIGFNRCEGRRTEYYDRLTVDAGWLTPIAALFVRILFRHRQRRLRQLARNGFAMVAA